MPAADVDEQCLRSFKNDVACLHAVEKIYGFMKRYCLAIVTYFLVCAVAMSQNRNTARKLFQEGKYEEAKPMFAKLLAGNPKNSEYNYWYAVCCYETGDTVEIKEMLEFARRLIDQLLENETTLPPLHYLEGGDLNLLLAKACLRLGDREEALSHLERMVRYDLEQATAFRGDAMAKSFLLCNVNLRTFYSIPSDRPQRLRAKLTDADLEPLQDHPRFQRLMDRVNQTINQQKMES